MIYELHVTGLVQGVGFRPFVARLASQFNFKGWVQNLKSSVLICLECPETQLPNFLIALNSQLPSVCRIDHIDYKKSDLTPSVLNDGFEIKGSEGLTSYGEIPKDLAPCDNCKAEMLNPNSRRYDYGFTACCDCGPRYSMLFQLPFDREHTAMCDFHMCESCHAEYTNMNDRRFHAQGNCCENCGPQLKFMKQGEPDQTDHSNAIEQAVNVLKQGGILLLKGIGGYQYLCRPDMPATVSKIKKLKSRNRKAFALLVSDLDMAQSLVNMSESGQQCLTSQVAPIVLAPKHALETQPLDWIESISQDSGDLGVMLPGSALHFLIGQKIKQPLICTSANLAGESMLIDDDAVSDLLPKVDGVLTFNRKIHHRLDDSIFRDMGDEVLCIRPARGIAPLYVGLGSNEAAGGTHLAMGAELKSTFSLSVNGKTIMSQYQGDLHKPVNLDAMEKELSSLLRLLNVKPINIAHDQHPDFQTTKLAAELAKNSDHPVQHHQAHVLSCASEHDLTPDTKVVALALDGFGFSKEQGVQQVWGGECFAGTLNDLEHIGHLQNLVRINQQYANEPWRCYLAYLIQSGCELPTYLDGVDQTLYQGFVSYVKHKMINEKDGVENGRSCGRLFDAISFALGCLGKQQEYESQGAIALERLAQSTDHDHSFPYAIEQVNQKLTINFNPAWQAFNDQLKDNNFGDTQAYLARKWINTICHALADLVKEVIKEQGEVQAILLSGGCMQNRLLRNGLKNALQGTDRQILFHSKVPCNDSGVSVGQMYYLAMQQAKQKQQNKDQLCA